MKLEILVLARVAQHGWVFGVLFGASVLIGSGQAKAAQMPFGGTAWPIPGTIEVENFDEGGEGVAYHDNTPVNEGGAYRNTGVDIYSSSEATGGYYVAMEEGEWVEFTVNVEESALYDMSARVLLNNLGGAEFRLFVDDRDITLPVAVPGYVSVSGETSAWAEVSRPGVVLKAGQHVLRLLLSQVLPFSWSTAHPINFDALRFARSPLVPSQVISGTGQPGFADGPPDQARFSTNITGLDVDLSGNIYVADSGNFRVRKVSPGGVVTTLAGVGTDGTANGPGGKAQFSLLRGVAVDDSGNCYVTDGSASDGLNKIRRIAADGNVSTVYSEARGSTDFSSITVNREGVVHFLTASSSGSPPLYLDTISKLPAAGSRINLLTTGATGMGGTRLVSLSAGHNTPDLYYARLYHYINDYSSTAAKLDTNGGSTDLYTVPGVHVGNALVADRSGKIYFGVANYYETILNRLPPTGAPQTVYVAPGLEENTVGVDIALGADINGDLYAFENNRLITLLINYRGFGLTAFTLGGGTVTIDPPGPVYVTNAVVNVTASPSPGWTFIDWTNDISSTETNLTLTMTNDVSLQAVFGIPLQTAAPNGAVVRDPDYGMYPYGTIVGLTARPDYGFEFIRWNDGVTNAVRTEQITITNFVTLSPVFSAIPKYTLTVGVLGGVGGTVSRSPDQADYFRDTPVVVSAHPGNGYVFQVWLDNVLDNPRTVVIGSNTTLFAVFAPGQGTAPQITSAPRDANVSAGDQAVFTVVAQGSSPLEYQWWRTNGVIIAGAISSTLILSNVQPVDAGSYTVVVSNSVTTATATAQLNVFSPFRFESISIQPGGQVQFAIVGDAGNRYQIDQSATLNSWQPLVVLTNTTGVVQFTEPVLPGTSRRFYRASLLPGL